MSKTIGRSVEVSLGGKKRRLRVDIEPGGKVQIQSGRGKKSTVDLRIDPNRSVREQIEEAFRKIPENAKDQLTKNAERGIEILRETGNL